MRPKPMRLLFLLPAGTNRFLSMLGQLIAHSDGRLAPFNVRARSTTIKSFNPDLLARQLWRARDKVDGIAFMALEHPAVREAVDTTGRARRADGDADLGYRSMRAAPPMSDWTIARPDAPPAI